MRYLTIYHGGEAYRLCGLVKQKEYADLVVRLSGFTGAETSTSVIQIAAGTIETKYIPHSAYDEARSNPGESLIYVLNHKLYLN